MEARQEKQNGTFWAGMALSRSLCMCVCVSAPQGEYVSAVTWGSLLGKKGLVMASLLMQSLPQSYLWSPNPLAAHHHMIHKAFPIGFHDRFSIIVPLIYSLV